MGIVTSIISFIRGRSSKDEVTLTRTTEEANYPTKNAGWRKGGYKPPKANADAAEELYPNCDIDIWLRSCEQEVPEPVEGKTTGVIPHWIKGTLLRNGPGLHHIGETSFQHLFDCSALLHRFAIDNGKVTYQCRFLQSNTFRKNMAAKRIVVTEFGTKAVPDPCQSIFSRVAALFNPGECQSDNAMISIYPFGDDFYTFTETPVIHKIDPKTLETKERVNLAQKVGIVSHTSHPHVMEDGTVFNIGMVVGSTGPKYTVFKFPPPKNWKPQTMDARTNEKHGDTSNGNAEVHGDDEAEEYDPFATAEVVGGISARWPLHPGYMHSFGVTENFFIIVEQPLSISVPETVLTTLLNEAMASSFRWYQDKPTLIHLMDRKTGKLYATYSSDSFFYLHVINSYESHADTNKQNGEKYPHVIIDICCYQDPSMLDCMYVDALKGAQQNADYASMFHGRPQRFKLPLHNVKENASNKLEFSETHKADSPIPVRPEQLCDLGCETPRINTERNLGKDYNYFYAISSDVNIDNPGTIIKVNVKSGKTKTWGIKNIFPSEPIFIPHPSAQSEDDGVLLSALVWGGEGKNKAGFLVLDAKTMTELGRTEFELPGPVPKCLHGWFAPGLV
ncbi:carotenoid isomerooxygenase-like isoform X2 [Ischnura elegans]|uniref:carotenoid isomerooxygenase-like isoform X2 n=1 Tax=Ischnura elegans TaxID=197161 RepID=UPI001ED8B400|nr:carotenoid isomerooxygenase-like isoform X2 [Ischnura elegans]